MAYIDAKGVLTEGESWVGIDTHTCTADDTEITFTSQTGSTDYKKNWSQYQDLILISTVRSNHNNPHDYMHLTFNNKTSAYWHQYMYVSSGTFSAIESNPLSKLSIGTVTAAQMPAGYFAPSMCEMFEINSGKYKSSISEWGHDKASTASQVGQYACTWADTSDGMLSTNYLHTIDITLNWGDFVSGSKFDLFGVLPRMTENTAVAY